MRLALLVALAYAVPLLGWWLAVRHWERERRREWSEFEDRWWEEHSEEKAS